VKPIILFPNELPCCFSIFNQDTGFFNPDFSQLLNSLNSKTPFEKGGNFDINLDNEGFVFVYDNFRDIHIINNPLYKIKYCFIVKVTSKSSDSFYNYKYQFTPVMEMSIADLTLIQGRSDNNKFSYFRVAVQKLQ
jgi:hypothetical protein